MSYTEFFSPRGLSVLIRFGRYAIVLVVMGSHHVDDQCRQIAGKSHPSLFTEGKVIGILTPIFYFYVPSALMLPR